MKLQEYLEKNKFSYTGFADQIGVTPQTVRRYALDIRIPEKPVMRKIAAVTKNKVMANDFY